MALGLVGCAPSPAASPTVAPAALSATGGVAKAASPVPATAASPVPATAGSPVPAAPAPAASSDKWDQMLAAGRKEGTVVIAGPPFAALREAYTQQFTRDTGIQLQYLGVPTGELSARAEREATAGKPSMDVLLGGGTELYTLLPKGLLEPIAPALVLPEVVRPTDWHGDNGVHWMDADRQYIPVPANWVMTDLFVNTQTVPLGTLASWKDLLKPEFKGKIISTDPRAGGPGQAVGRYLLHKFGEQFVVDLYKGQDVNLVRDERQVAEAVAKGQYPIGLGTVQITVEEFRRAGLPIAREFPADGPGSLLGGFSALKLMKNAPNPAAGAVFVNWALGKNGQTAYAEALLEPSLRKDVSTTKLPDYVVPKPGVTYDLDQYEYDFYINSAPKLGERLRDLLGR
jgi:iron(III) transport system substrate-binding protein